MKHLAAIFALLVPLTPLFADDTNAFSYLNSSNFTDKSTALLVAGDVRKRVVDLGGQIIKVKFNSKDRLQQVAPSLYYVEINFTGEGYTSLPIIFSADGFNYLNSISDYGGNRLSYIFVYVPDKALRDKLTVDLKKTKRRTDARYDADDVVIAIGRGTKQGYNGRFIYSW